MNNTDWDNRWKREQPKKPRWLLWHPGKPLRYLITITSFLVVVPFVLQLHITPLGAFINIMFIDYLLYLKETSKMFSK